MQREVALFVDFTGKWVECCKHSPELQSISMAHSKGLQVGFTIVHGELFEPKYLGKLIRPAGVINLMESSGSFESQDE